MPTITRGDNTEFIVQPYRERLNLKNYTILKREIRYLAQINGQFVRLFKMGNGMYETVFSHDPGFLLGESIWQYFGKPENLLYCEELNQEEVLLVLIRSGSVYLDGKYLKTAIKEELGMLANTSVALIIKMYGDVPITEDCEAEPEKFCFDEIQIKSFTKLSEPVFARLPVRGDLQLLSLEQGLLEHRTKVPLISSLIVLAVVVLGGSLLLTKSLTPPPKTQQELDPYLNYRSMLATPSPEKELIALSKQISETYSMPGWTATKLSSNGATATVQLHSLGGTLHQLFTWAKTENTRVDLGTTGATLLMRTAVSQRPQPLTIVNTKNVTAYVIDQMLAILPGKSVKITSFKSFGVYKEAVLEISVNSISPDILSLIGLQLNNLPVKLNNVSLQLDQGLLTGTIQIAILGN